MSEDELSALGKYSRETVKEHYSMDTMADDAIRMYISIIKNSFINRFLGECFKTIHRVNDHATVCCIAFLIRDPLGVYKITQFVYGV